eukprot:jgi/Chrzof1/6216/Cz17g16030.t1
MSLAAYICRTVRNPGSRALLRAVHHLRIINTTSVTVSSTSSSINSHNWNVNSVHVGKLHHQQSRVSCFTNQSTLLTIISCHSLTISKGSISHYDTSCYQTARKPQLHHSSCSSSSSSSSSRKPNFVVSSHLSGSSTIRSSGSTSTMGPWNRMVDNIASKLAFFPPNPPTYEVKSHGDGGGELYVQPTDKSYPRVLSAKVHYTTTPKLKGYSCGGESIVTAFVPYKDARGRQVRPTLLYSHGNAVDLGQMLPVYRELGKLLHANVMGYDYTGYGPSTSLPSVSHTLSDISGVLGMLRGQHNIAPADVVLYGQSVGSGPTVWLAAQKSGVAGVILHSPLLSGVRVFNPGLKFWPSWADIYPNHLLIKRVTAPVLVMHGTHDDVINVSAGQKLAELAPQPFEPLIAEGYDHQNLEMCPQYVPHLRRFLAHCFPGEYQA